MKKHAHLAALALLGAALMVSPLRADLTESLKEGTPDIKSIGAMAFGPDGVLFVGDTQSGAIFAIDTGDRKPVAEGMYKVQGIDAKIASLLGTDSKMVMINDLAVNPASGRAYLSVSRGRGPDAKPVMLRLTQSGEMEEMSLKGVKFAKAVLPNANSQKRQEAITDLAYVDGKVIVAGLSNEQFASNLRAIPFPFSESNKGSSVEIFHGAHGRFETASPVRTFTLYDIKGEPNVLAAYTCTPLVRFPLSQLKPGEKVKGTTVAELGNRNRPLDMITYTKGGKDYILLANSARGVMKITTENIDSVEGITAKVNGTRGLPYETIASLKGVEQLDRQDKDHALLLIRTEQGGMNLESVPLP